MRSTPSSAATDSTSRSAEGRPSAVETTHHPPTDETTPTPPTDETTHHPPTGETTPTPPTNANTATIPAENPAESLNPVAAKCSLRHQIRQARDQIGARARGYSDARRCAALIEWLRSEGLHTRETTAALYLSRPPEPDPTEAIRFLLESSMTILVPSLKTTVDPFPSDPRSMPIRWAPLTSLDSLLPGRWGIPEADTEPASAEILGRADVIVIPALACTSEGKRLGMGGGWYDRALTWARPSAPIVALINDAELLDDLPTQPHDRQVSVIITESRVIKTGAESPHHRG